MKFLVIGLFLVYSLYGDEIQRIESIVKDITKLRVAYEECQAELRDKKPVKMAANISINSDIEKYKKLLKIKDKKIKSLENKLKEKVKKQIIIKKEYENPNKFPKLALKFQYLDKKPQEEKVEVVKASTFRLKVDSDIYDKISGDKIETWEKSRSFTSNKMSQNWIKITGYFVDKKWKKTKHGMWVRKKQVIKR